MRIALPNKGSLAEPAASLLQRGGYRTHREARALSCRDVANDVEFLFLRPRDIAVYVANGHLDVGITGTDLMCEAGGLAETLLELGFARSSFRFAAPKAMAIDVIKQLDGLRIATSFPRLVEDCLERHGVAAQVIRLDGAVEVAIELGVADVIADVVETGASLAAAGLKVCGEPVLESQAVLIRRLGAERSPQINQLVDRLQGVLLAQRYVLLDYDIEADHLDQACAIAPGLQSPTIARLQTEGWCAVRTMVPKEEVQHAMDQLAALGAKALLVTEIQACRL